MKIDLWKCDVCGKEFRKNGGFQIDLFLGREMDAAGYTDSVYKSADICSACQSTMLLGLIDKMTMDERLDLAKKWGAK